MALDMDAALFGDTPATVKRSLSRLPIDDGGVNMYTLTEFDGSELTITTTDGSRAWSGQVTSKDFASLARDVKMSVTDFTSETLKALTRENMGDLACVYSVELVGGESLKLCWKRNLREEKIKFQLGSVILSSYPLQTANCSMLEYAVETIVSLNNDIARSEQDKATLAREHRGALSRLDDCAKLKENIENDLYGKFRLVLNDKKAKIRHLVSQLSNLSEHNKCLQSNEDHGNTPSNANEDDPNIDSANKTDKEMESSPKPKVPVELDSLLDEHKETTAPPPIVKRRRREPQSSTRSTEIPKPPSLKSPEVSMRSRKRSFDVEESLESDKLLGLL